MSRAGVVCAILSCDATMTSDHDAIMCVWCEANGKEVNSKCGKIASSLIVRHTILGGIGVIQQWVGSKPKSEDACKHDDGSSCSARLVVHISDLVFFYSLAANPRSKRKVQYLIIWSPQCF